MASVKAMQNPLVLKLASGLIKKDAVWQPAHHAKLLWNLFRTKVADGGMLIEKPEDKVQAVKNWESLYGLVSYPSNTARRLAEAGICAKPLSEEVKGDTEGLL